MTQSPRISITHGYRVSLRRRYDEVIRNLSELAVLPKETEFELISRFVTPLALAPIAHLVGTRQLRPDVSKCPSQVRSYLSAVGFPFGKSPMAGGVSARATYLPLTRLSLARAPEQRTRALEGLQDSYHQILQQNLSGDEEFLERITTSTFELLLQELCDNIAQHALASDVLVLAQYWPNDACCEICLLDNGQGWYRSLLSAGRKVTDSVDAVSKVVNQGLSAKDEFGEEHRGTGIRNTRNLLLNDEVRGDFSVFTGDALYSCTAGQEPELRRISEFSWQGTLITLRVRKPRRRVNIYDYVS